MTEPKFDRKERQKFARLKKSAMESCTFRGHSMNQWITFFPWWGGIAADSYCAICKADVRVETRPRANGIDIGGPAVAINCKDGESEA